MSEITFCDLRRKEIINVEDGRCLGFVCDVVFEQCSGKILGIVVPGEKKFFSIKRRQEIFINYHSICKIGEDVILVDVCYTNCNSCVPFCKTERR